MNNVTWVPDPDTQRRAFIWRENWIRASNNWARTMKERDQARRIARTLYDLYLQVKDFDFDVLEEYAAYEAVSYARRVIAEEAKRAP